MTVRRAVRARAGAQRPVAPIAARAGAELVADRFAWVDAARRIAHTEGGADLSYDALSSPSAHGRARPSRTPSTIDDRRMDEQLRGLVQDIEGGYVHSVAFVVAAPAWAGRCRSTSSRC